MRTARRVKIRCAKSHILVVKAWKKHAEWVGQDPSCEGGEHIPRQPSVEGDGVAAVACDGLPPGHGEVKMRVSGL